MKWGIAAIALTVVFGAGFTTAQAQNYPSKPVRVIMSSSAGGTSDIFMWVLADELHKRIGQPFILENRPGGSFNIGARACAEAAPDGYTVCMMSAEPVAFNQYLFKTLPFDPTAFVPITQFFYLTQMMVVSAELNVRTIPELVALSKAKPGTLSYATAAVPTGVFLERWKTVAGIDMVRVPFRGGGEAVTSLLNGATPVGFYGIANLRELLEGGKLHGLMVDSLKRSPLYPDIPTIEQATGLTFNGRSWFGLFAPPGTPATITQRLQVEIAQIFARDDFSKKHMIERGLEPVASTPEEFGRFVNRDRVWSEQIIKDSGLQPQ
ncbi:Bug family tripartite tricarboxylate transporter substrate binding protein [Rhodoplanes sp. Z2-YC6860]|uniref:Bug family tripartite tricarboxylate transporter substrate binding protein n=1 Tax=Rhodoplanes sp. Z2-YC6860 TaxID=674703 RepID=UPI00078D2489|nr:tripartite tricarboxylate transporter substrate-binding protein [Rhodoplanes sp. Z2-YC6860]AMN43841.1 ABC transporter substrate-binding protein [Rhodoplanes sp. Z2-YC6860]